MTKVSQLATVEDLIQEDVIKLMGLDPNTKEEQERIRTLMVETAQNRIAARVLVQLDQETALDWQKHLAEENLAAADQLLLDHDLDINQIAVEEILLLKAQYLHMAADVYSRVQKGPQAAPGDPQKASQSQGVPHAARR